MNRVLKFVCCAAAILAAAGCATTQIIDSDVQTFSSLQAAPATSTFRFERLPSQQSQAAQQAKLEDIATQALVKVGFRRDDAAARYVVQVEVRSDQEAPAWDPLYGPGWPERTRIITGVGPGRVIWAPSMRFPPAPTLYRREVGLLIREMGSNRIVYETHAVHEGVWSQDPATLAAMFDAALRDFPNPLTGVRRVNVEIPR
jgi:uncharacterized protein DUF4136